MVNEQRAQTASHFAKEMFSLDFYSSSCNMVIFFSYMMMIPRSHRFRLLICSGDRIQIYYLSTQSSRCRALSMGWQCMNVGLFINACYGQCLSPVSSLGLKLAHSYQLVGWVVGSLQLHSWGEPWAKLGRCCWVSCGVLPHPQSASSIPTSFILTMLRIRLRYASFVWYARPRFRRLYVGRSR